MVGASKSTEMGKSTWYAFLIIANSRTAISEWPPRSKKLSSTPTCSTPSSSSQKPASVRSMSLPGATYAESSSGRANFAPDELVSAGARSSSAFRASSSSEETMSCGRPFAIARRKASAPSVGRMPWET